jgi:hypothetical protein
VFANYKVELIRQSGTTNVWPRSEVAALSVCVMALSREVSGNVTLCRVLVPCCKDSHATRHYQAHHAVLCLLLEPDNAVVQVLIQ